MRLRRPGLAAGLALAVLGAAGSAQAQGRDPLTGAVVDLRMLTVSLPSGAGWTPSLSDGGVVPGRGFGGEAGASVFVGPGRFRRLALGVTALGAQGRATALDGPTVTTRLLALAPQATLAFGHRDGWSYLSAGAGAASVRSEADGGDPSPVSWGLVVHYGGGARWFVSRHVAVSLDLRFWALTPRAATAARAAGAANTRVALGAGVSIH
ncbi:MAG: hypothetical protein AB7O28_09370 [Vicinamibacterales bacterium]